MGGRKARPVELLLLNGNKNRLTKSEIESRRKAEAKIKPGADKVRPPAWLDAIAKKEFKRLAAELLQTEIISNVDVNQLAIYCRSYSRYVQLQKGIPATDMNGEPVLDADGNEVLETNEKELDILYKQLKGMAAEFGFTPSSRAKIAIQKPEEKQKTPEEEMFGGV
jgi:P27 family predicted phage terminase small subunit